MHTPSDWLVKLAEKQPTDMNRLQSALNDLPVDELTKLASELKYYRQPTNTEAFIEKVAQAQNMGIELAQNHRTELLEQILGQEKTAYQLRYAHDHDHVPDQTVEMGRGRMTPQERAEDTAVNNRGLLRTLGSAGVGGVAGGLLGAVSRHPEMALHGGILGASVGAFGGGLYHHLTEGRDQRDKLREAAYNRPQQLQMVQPSKSIEKKAGVLGSIASKATGMALRNPTAALGIGGAAAGGLAGAATASPGEAGSGALKGALMGGGIGLGAGALGAGKALKQGVLGIGTSAGKPMLGKGAQDYARNAVGASARESALGSKAVASRIQTTGQGPSSPITPGTPRQAPQGALEGQSRGPGAKLSLNSGPSTVARRAASAVPSGPTSF